LIFRDYGNSLATLNARLLRLIVQHPMSGKFRDWMYCRQTRNIRPGLLHAPTAALFRRGQDLQRCWLRLFSVYCNSTYVACVSQTVSIWSFVFQSGISGPR